MRITARVKVIVQETRATGLLLHAHCYPDQRVHVAAFLWATLY